MNIFLILFLLFICCCALLFFFDRYRFNAFCEIVLEIFKLIVKFPFQMLAKLYPCHC